MNTLKIVFPIPFTKLPISILLIGLYFILTPIISYFTVVYYLNIPILEIKSILLRFNWLQITLNSMGVLVGFGILGVKRWGYFLFLVYNFIMFLHGIYFIHQFGFLEATVRNLSYIVFPFLLTLYFFNREISIPYLTLIPRGFRSKWRIEVPVSGQIVLNDTTWNIETLDISPRGCLIKTDQDIEIGSVVKIFLNLESPWETNGVVVRNLDGEQGIQFLYEKKDARYKEIKKFLNTKLLPRYNVNSIVNITSSSNLVSGSLINISEGGFYFSTNEKLKIGEEIQYKIHLYGFIFSGKGKISWDNPNSKYGKPKGYGVSFALKKISPIYRTIIFLVEKLQISRDR
jgi:Tfp pilus assembly protein PilZ